jgi:DNA-binding transcriptional ArsR family regulator
MSSDAQVPDYDVEDLRVVTSPQQLRAMADPLRQTILDLVTERAATVAELASAVSRPNSTVAHHVGVLTNTGLLRVVRTRRVRAIDERYYGRTALIYYVGVVPLEQGRVIPSSLQIAATESDPANQADDLRAVLRHARISRERVVEFWERVFDLTREFSRLPRSGDMVYGFVAGLYPVQYPTPPDANSSDHHVE